MKWSFVSCNLIFFVVWAMLFPAGAYAAPPGIDTNAAGAALIDVESGRILYSKKGDERMRIASLTKIMTAIVAIDHGSLADIVMVSKNAYGKEGSSIYLKLGEEMSLQHMLYGMMLRSGNDAAIAIAEHVGGSLEGFIYLMNEKAKLLGMENSHFINPSGLDDGAGHYSSPNDMAKLTAYALKNPVFREIVSTKTKKVPNPNEDWDYTWFNKNKMLHLFDGADGVKTGYTKLAKRCLVSSATRGGQQLAVVTLNDPDDWADHARLLTYGFQNYPLQPIVNKGDTVEGAEGVIGRSFAFPMLEEERSSVIRKLVPADRNSTDYKLGGRGSVQILIGGKQVGAVPLYAQNSAKLRMKERTAFIFTEIPTTSLIAQYTRTVKIVLHSLFAASN